MSQQANISASKTFGSRFIFFRRFQEYRYLPDFLMFMETRKQQGSVRRGISMIRTFDGSIPRTMQGHAGSDAELSRELIGVSLVPRSTRSSESLGSLEFPEGL